MVQPRYSVFIAASLDGFIARANGGIDWLAIVDRAGEDYGFQAFFSTIDAMVIGRKTYETALGFDAWPYAGKRVVVLTHSTRTSRHGEEFFAGNPAELAQQLGAQGVKHVYVDGGAVIAQFLRDNRVDELTVSVIPILLGEGAPLAPGVGRDVNLHLVAHRVFESGLVQLVYRPRA